MDWNSAAFSERPVGSLQVMASKDRIGDTPLLDDWLAEVGDDAVIEAVAEARQSIADGKTPAFSDKDEFIEHLRRHHRQTA